ncbi:hypothetical protein EJB05_31989, partial [Eragrostis curvula]
LPECSSSHTDQALERARAEQFRNLARRLAESCEAGIMASEKSKILVVGGTGHLGRHVVAASARLGHPTIALVRDMAPSDPAKAQLLKSFQDLGVTLVKGDLYDHASLVSAVKALTWSSPRSGSSRSPTRPGSSPPSRRPATSRTTAEHNKFNCSVVLLLSHADARLELGSRHRFFPSEFGLNVDRTGAVEPARSILSAKVAIRRAVEASEIPYTFVVAGFFAGHGLPSIGQVLSRAPPTDKAVVLGDGNTKVVFVEEGDIGTYTVLAAADPRAKNKTLYIKPPADTLSHNELLSLWEKKIGKTFRREYLPEDAVLK